MADMRIGTVAMSPKVVAQFNEKRWRQQQQITCRINEDIVKNRTGSSVDSLEMADQVLTTGGDTHRNNIFISLKRGGPHAQDRNGSGEASQEGYDGTSAGAILRRKLNSVKPAVATNYQYHSPMPMPSG